MRRPTMIVLLLFVLALGAYYLLNNRKTAAATTALTTTPGPTTEVVAFLFDANDGVPRNIKVESKAGKVVELARDAVNAWVFRLPIEAAADQALVEAAASQVTAMRVQDKIENIDLDVLGLKSPEYVLTITFTNGKERKAEVGVVTPSETGYYVLNEKGEVVIINKDAVDALLGLLTNPPYAVTATPSPIVTETPLPSSTPEAVTTETATPAP